MGRVKELPGVQAVALSTSPPFYGHQGAGPSRNTARRRRPMASADRREVDALYVDGDYFQSMGLPLLRGRYFSPVDHVPSTATARDHRRAAGAQTSGRMGTRWAV